MHLPAAIEADLAKGRLDFAQKVDQLVDGEVQRQLETVKRFNRELRDIDPYLELVFISTPRDWPAGEEPPPGCVFDRWHVLRRNPGAVPTFIALTREDGGYVEPTSRVFDRLRQGDLWNGDVARKHRMAMARKAEERARAADARRAEAREEIAMRLKALENPGIRFGGSWTKRAGKASK